VGACTQLRLTKKHKKEKKVVEDLYLDGGARRQCAMATRRGRSRSQAGDLLNEDERRQQKVTDDK